MPTSSSDTQFVPRPEFRPDDRITSSFSVLTLSGSAFIRAYGFPPPVAAAFRRHLELRQLILQYREDTAEDLYEFALHGKPWNNPRRIQSERLLIDLLSIIILQNGYHFLSTIDYGREQDDRVIMTFSRPNTPPSHSPRASTSVIQGVGNESVTTCSPHVTQTLFALSFPNFNTLRVISPPLHSTPAILKTVRGSCPRRVVSEKAAGNNVYEFKLKGYKWFKQDTFATDSLRHVISLLSSLDSYGFTLLTSLSLENPSRVKDLWIFTGPAHTPNSESAISSPNHSTAEVRRAAMPDPKASNIGGFALTTQDDVFARAPGHARSASDTAAIRQHSPVIPQHHGILRKPAPRAKLPESIRLSNSSHENLLPADGHTIMHRTSEELIRATMASTVGSAVDMTGIGTHKFQPIPSPAEGYPATHQAAPPRTSPTVFYTASPSGHNPYFPSFPPKHPEDPTTPHSAATGPTAPHHTHTKHNMTHPASSSADMAPRHTGPANRPPPTPSSSGDPGHSHSGSSSSHSPHSQSHMPGNLTPPLLSPGAFRDSAFSSNTGQTCEIPIKWTGSDHEKNGAVPREPHFPGGWVSPVVEDPREEVQQAGGGGTYRSASESPRRRDFARPGSREREHSPERQEVKVAAPKVVHPMFGRNSEAAVVGEFSHRHDKGKQKEPPVPLRPSHEHEAHRPAQPLLLLITKAGCSSTSARALLRARCHPRRRHPPAPGTVPIPHSRDAPPHPAPADLALREALPTPARLPSTGF
ncbi:hypothetical protein EWM64_g3728 [Hericium alpestre]|uniref:Uncharacterized protein n=1 Tax=Hericium alpestre TaxID=135208 RepID=A0A4Z0A1E1_9AGAM|nr:hypothetical protein EWM64_g3728 [Hericium alpestre]